MTEPKRLLDLRDAPSEVTHLLRVARHDVPPPGLRRTTWQGLVRKSAAVGLAVGASSAATGQGAALAATTTSGAGAATGAQAILSKGVLLLTLKSVAAGTGIGICALSTHYVISETMNTGPSLAIPTAQTTPMRVVATKAARPAPGASAESVQPGQPERLEADPIPPIVAKSGGSLVPVAVPKNSFGEQAQLEARRVAQIRQMLRVGEGHLALKSLADLDGETSLRLLGQERDALKIDALLMLGRNVEARRLEAQFCARYPNSPLRKRWNE